MWLTCLVFTNLVFLVGSQDVTYPLKEESRSGTFLGNVANDMNLQSMVTTEDFQSLRYTFLVLGNPHSSLFRIDNESSFLYTAQKLDREALCEFNPSCVLSLNIAAQGGVFFRKIIVDVHLEDTNDNSPNFTKQRESFEVSESFTVGKSISLQRVIDIDLGNNSVQTYMILPSNSPFSAELYERTVDGQSSVLIVLTRELDREKRDFYGLQLLAKDGGVPTRTGTMALDITVTDVNDNRPLFTNSVYNVTVKENITINTVIQKVSATDMDLGENGEVIYSLSSHQPDSIRNLFAIDEVTGELSVIGELVYQSSNIYSVIIEASDKAEKPRISQARVNVNILDSTNSPPEININLLSTSGVHPHTASVSEFASIGTPVAHIGVVDPDSGRNGIVACSVQDSHFELQRLDVKEYKVIVSKPLNRELKDLYTISVFCEDTGLPPMSKKETFNVTVTDVNDNQPRFLQQNYFVHISENNEIGKSLVQVSAEDIDLGKNGDVRYILNPQEKFPFQLDSKTGVLSANFQMDRENDSQITIQVLAVDSGSPPLTGTATVIVNVLDENDNKPVFLQNVFTFDCNESKPSNSVVGSVVAFDPDQAENGTFVISLLDSHSSRIPFTVSADGIIRLNGTVDRETESRYEFVVLATDAGQLPQSGSTNVVIKILDNNDNSPVIAFPNSRNRTVFVPYVVDPKTVIMRINAYDLDDGDNGRLSFFMQDKNATGLFQVNVISGEVMLVRKLDLADVKAYKFTILVKDNGSPERETKEDLVINVMPSVREEWTDEHGQNVRIAITLACVTVVVSAAIVLTICLIRQLDKGKGRNMGTVDLGKPEQNGNAKKVSFSLAEPAQHFPSEGSDGVSRSPPDKDMKQPTATSNGSAVFYDSAGAKAELRHTDRHIESLKQQKLSQLTAIKLRQSLLQSHDKAWTNQSGEPSIQKDVLKQRQDDSHSEDSGETADSGRGGSESDIHSNGGLSQSHDSDLIQKCALSGKPLIHHSYPRHNSWNNTNNNNYKNNRTENSSHQTQQGVPKHSTNYNRFHNYSPGANLSPIMRNSPWSHQSVHWPSTHLSVISDTIDNSIGTYDDDDDRTTTSGSYTIDQEDPFGEISFLSHSVQDCIV